ncbi:MAG: ABC transporter ATP-binding protein [Acidobacteriota bacterium]
MEKKLSDYFMFILRALKMVWQNTPVLTILNIIIILFQAVLPLAALFLMKNIVDSVTKGISAVNKLSEFNTVLFWIALAAGVAVLSAIFASISSYISEAQSLRITDSMMEMIHKRSVIADLQFYEDPEYFNTLRRAQKEAPHRPSMIVKKLVDIIKNSLSLAGIGVLLFSFNWWLGLILVFVAFPSALVKIKFSRRMYGYQEKHVEIERKSWYFHMVMTDREFAKEIRLFNLGDFFVSRFKDIATILRENKLVISKRKVIYEVSTQVLTTAAIFGTFAFICYQTLGGFLTLGGMVMYYQGFQRGLNFLKSLLGSLAGLYEDNLFLTNFYKFLDIEPVISSPEDPEEVPETGDLRLKDITFTYPGSEKPVLSGIDFSIPHGKVAALVGENGSGKSTIVKLACRFYDPDAGDISFNGIDLKKMKPMEWRKKISVVFQDFIKYDLTAEENIRVGNIEKTGDRSQESGDRISQLKKDKFEARSTKLWFHSSRNPLRLTRFLDRANLPKAKFVETNSNYKNSNFKNRISHPFRGWGPGEDQKPVLRSINEAEPESGKEMEWKDEIVKAARLSGADTVLNKLPDGYNSQLGKMFEEGKELSIGEWQKIAIARAFYRDSDIIILDEPSSSLDPLSEAELFEQFKKLIKGKTAILISHRFSTVKMADKIFVMKDKKIIEEGSHKELINKKGFYYKMYYSQAKNYEKC